MEPQACKNCDYRVSQSFCPQCGQKVVSKRLSVRTLLAQTVEVITNVEKGFWYTTIMLFKNPGQVAREVLSGATVRYFNPFRFLVIWMTITAFINLSTNLLERAIEASNIFFEKSGDEALSIQPEMLEQANTLMEYMPLLTLFFIPFLGIVSYWLFRKEGYNFAEHMVALTYFYSAFSILNLAWYILYFVYPVSIIFSQALSGVVGIIYLIIAYKSWFGLKAWPAIWKGTMVFGWGNLFFSLFIAGATIVYQLIMSLINVSN
jgi:hypothetical protein